MKSDVSKVKDLLSQITKLTGELGDVCFNVVENGEECEFDDFLSTLNLSVEEKLIISDLMDF